MQRALELDPNNPDILNNLAWVFATSKEAPLFQPEKALVLAEKAAASSQQSHILDTLAESYYVNGLTIKALATAEKALAAASGDRSVITSYSIHYTKLYDILPNPRAWRRILLLNRYLPAERYGGYREETVRIGGLTLTHTLLVL